MMVSSGVGDPRSVTRLECTCVISEQQHISVTIVVSSGAHLVKKSINSRADHLHCRFLLEGATLMLCQTGTPTANEHVMQQSPRRLSGKRVALAPERPISAVKEPQNPISFILRPVSQTIKTQVMSFFNSIGCAILRQRRRRRHARWLGH
jgi:hypothetical protein